MDVRLEDFQYNLPEDRIAQFPLTHRDDSRLLFYHKGKVSDQYFKNITSFIPQGASLFFNNTKVIPARLFFHRNTGALIEIFLLSPLSPSREIQEAMQVRNTTIWTCMVGNKKKWKPEEALTLTLQINESPLQLSASWADREKGLVQFSWAGDTPFVQVIEACGKVPLPPYLNREAIDEDKPRYQTVYSVKEGAVAAPTAGLHFTDKQMQELSDQGINHDYLTLHVSAGTFQPIKASTVEEHPMHAEQIVLSRKLIENILEADFPIPVGTTSMRSLESLYWFGVKISEGQSAFQISQNEPYKKREKKLSKKQSLTLILKYMDEQQISTLYGETSIFIYPGYEFKVCKGLITNFHQPGSTLILLIAAFIGKDWKALYQHALEKNYRFLSYGDSSLLIP